MISSVCRTPGDALAAALEALDEIPPAYTVSGVTFGEFSAGGFYWSINVNYELGNTQRAREPHIRDDLRKYRTKLVVNEWVLQFQTPKEVNGERGT